MLKEEMYTEDNNDIVKGSVIEHEQYGIGAVTKVEGSLIEVAFKTGIKKLMKSVAPISKI